MECDPTTGDYTGFDIVLLNLVARELSGRIDDDGA